MSGKKSILSSTEKTDMVNSPKHYRMQGVEAIDLKGNISKYILRYKHKSKPKEDLQKAKWYIEKLIEKI